MDSRPVMDNMGLVFAAINVIKIPLQNLIAEKMERMYGEDYWSEIVKYDKKRKHPSKDIARHNNANRDGCSKFLDVPYCLYLIEDFQLLKDIDSKTRAMDKVRNARNELFHSGVVEFEERDTKDCIQVLINLAECLGFDCITKLKEYREAASLPMEAPKTPAPAPEEPEEPEMINEQTEIIQDTGAAVQISLQPPCRMESLADICISSCSGFYQDLLDKQNDEDRKSTARSAIKAEIVKSKPTDPEGTFRLNIHSAITMDDSMIFLVDEEEFPIAQVGIVDYDMRARSMLIDPEPELKERLALDYEELAFSADMKWLISRAERFFTHFGGIISYPPSPGPREPKVAPMLVKRPLSKEQEAAVRGVISSPLSYVWGVPGSGKTQSVLATSIAECVSRGERVAVIAPTNLALEQVIEGLMKSFRDEPAFKGCINPEKDMVRIGIPTPAFMAKYPYICENERVRDELDAAYALLNDLDRTKMDRMVERQRGLCGKLIGAIEFMGEGTPSDRARLIEMAAPMVQALSDNPRYSVEAQGVGEDSIVDFIKEMSQRAYGGHYVDAHPELDDAALDKKIGEVEKKVSKLSKRVSRDLSEVSIVCMTLSKFIVTYGPYEYEGHKAVPVSHVFLDEAGYCSCIQALSLFSLGAPVTLLGDHMQLPPVCEIDRDVLVKHIGGAPDRRYSFLWDLPAMYVDRFFDQDPEALCDMYADEIEPTFTRTRECRIPTTYRFGKNLADILGERVYGFKMGSASKEPLEVIVEDVMPMPYDQFRRDGRPYRFNKAEAGRVKGLIPELGLGEDDSFIVLTPYKDQIRYLTSIGISKDKVLTIHKSQGREWDTVIISVCDNRNNGQLLPCRFTSTDANKVDARGLKPINTAVSRAKKRLIIVCDAAFWRKEESELIGDLVRSAGGTRSI